MTNLERLAQLKALKDPNFAQQKALSDMLSQVQLMKGEKGDRGDIGPKGDSVKGDKGDKGDASIVPGPRGRDGKDGKDGSTPDIDLIVELAAQKVKVPKPEKIVLPTLDEIVGQAVIELEKKKKKISIKDIHDLNELITFLKLGGFRGGGGTINNGGGNSGLTILASIGAITDFNTTFPFSEQPQLVVVNGFVYREKNGWSWDGLNASLDNAVGSLGDIYAITSGAQVYKTTGTIDNSNLTFPFAVQPQIVVINGNAYRQERGWTWDGNNAVIDFPVGTGGDIYGLILITPVQITISTIDNTNTIFNFTSQPTLVVPNGRMYRSGHGWSGSVVVDQPVGTGGDIYGL